MPPSPNNLPIRVEELGKTYQIWSSPKGRLKAFFIKALAQALTKLHLPKFARKLQNLAEKLYQDFHALRNVSFSVDHGEVVGIIGLNGSGKSTLLQIIAGVLQPTYGSCTTYGRVVALLELGAGFNGEFTGRENIYLNGAIMGISRKEMDKRFDEIASFAEIGEFIDQPVNTYSSGMTVRLAFAILTQVDPDVLIIDEALSVGDAYFNHKCAKCIQDFRNEGKTMLFVSHDPTAVKTLCNRAILIEKGVIIKEGKAESVVDYYNAIVAKKEKDQEIRQIESETGRVLTRSGNRKAEIGSIELTDDMGQPARAFLTGSKAWLKAQIVFHEYTEKPTFGILIRDRLGSDVFGTNTHFNHNTCPNKASGEKAKTTTELELNLGPGTYSITLAVHSGAVHTEESYDWIDHAVVFDVLPQTGKHFVGTAALPCQIEWS